MRSQPRCRRRRPRRQLSLYVLIRTALLLAFAWPPALALAQTAPTPATPLTVIAFDGGWNLPLWAAQRQGYFETNGVAVELAYTPNSVFLIRALLDGKHDIGFALIDNLIAYREGQGEASAPDATDLVAFLGGDGGFLS